jgi:uncharacterized membrane protein (UPF0127 family)
MVNIYCNEKLLTEKSKYINPLIGLMFARKLKYKEAAILDVSNYPSTVIHMAFVFQNLDVVCLNKNMKVIDVRKNIKPFSKLIYPVEKSYYYVESLPNSFDVKIGDILNFVEKKGI